MDSRNDRQRQTNKIKGNTEEHTFVAQELEKIYGWEVNEEIKMTFKALMNFGSFEKSPFTPVDRYHSGSGSYHHSSNGGYKGHKGGGNGAALSALTLLAFLFLINVMQQSLQDNNSTATATTTALFLRDDEQPIVLDAREKKDVNKKKDSDGTPPRSHDKNYVRL
ncbi:hypothetical protein HZH68_001070 [Vespula germanica]|uniref:Uncharacterized protein n=3 Tax=Vespula TaxID=7451 RepID=A0A834NUT3_VESGE|nr:hypothetical protein HZH68_001070 [Vespula germanica]KAF7438791.1 hypothetical protein H0235_001182 [Vespula pensylvanica]